MDGLKKGYWAIATQKHLVGIRSDSPNLEELDSLNIAGKAGRFIGAIRGNNRIDNIKRVEKMATGVGIGKRELHKIILPTIEKVSDKKIELIKNKTGDITGLEEYVFTNREVIDISGNVFEDNAPSEIERVIINTLDDTRKLPYLESELIHNNVIKGYGEENVRLSLRLQEQFKLIQKVEKSKSNDSIISNEYIWGKNHEKIAKAIASIEFDKRQNLKEVIDAIHNKQGISIENLPMIDPKLLLLAKKTGMINPTTIVTGRTLQKEFAFSPNIIEESEYCDDILDDVKLFLASIRFGENYTKYSTINDSCRFLEYLINNGEIGPHSANATDYIMLEKKGIVKVIKKREPGYNGIMRDAYYLKLLRRDIAEKVLSILKNPDITMKIREDIRRYDIINNSGDFISPEENRIKLAESTKDVREAQEHFCNVLRDEML